MLRGLLVEMEQMRRALEGLRADLPQPCSKVAEQRHELDHTSGPDALVVGAPASPSVRELPRGCSANSQGDMRTLPGLIPLRVHVSGGPAGDGSGGGQNAACDVDSWWDGQVDVSALLAVVGGPSAPITSDLEPPSTAVKQAAPKQAEEGGLPEQPLCGACAPTENQSLVGGAMRPHVPTDAFLESVVAEQVHKALQEVGIVELASLIHDVRRSIALQDDEEIAS